jgi:hypothetical protein
MGGRRSLPGRPLSACRPESHFVVSVSMLCLLAVPDRSALMAAVRPRHGAGALAPAGRFCLRAPMRTGGGRPGSPQAPSPDRARTGLPACFLNLAAEFVAGIAVTPEQVDADPGGFPVPEMSVSAGHVRPPPSTTALHDPTMRAAAGRIAFLNPAAATILGYAVRTNCSAGPVTRRSTICARMARRSPAAQCPLLRPRLTGETLHLEQDWLVRKRRHAGRGLLFVRAG